MKVITFSRVFPAKHPRKGQPTHFVEQIWNGLNSLKLPVPKNAELPKEFMWSILPLSNYGYKYHTIRMGNRWNVGDFFSARVWSDKPYRSKQIIIAPPIEIKKIWEVEISGSGNRKTAGIIQKLSRYRTLIPLADVAQNDGLEYDDFVGWFPKDFVGQIISWNDKIEY